MKSDILGYCLFLKQIKTEKMEKTFEQKMQEVIDFSNKVNERNAIVLMIEISEQFEGNQTFLLLNSLYETIEMNGKIKGIQDLLQKIMENPMSIIKS
jgi:hypothetical protein